MLNRALAAPLLLVAACSVPAPNASPPRAEPEPVLAQEAASPAAVVAVEPAASAHAEAASPTRALFLANCAQCHGEKGDGEGVTQLDRKARSFLDGGFSYGNTQDAILRSITHGIPGTPMPAFDKALNEAQRVELAEYVIAFGPDQIVVDPSESEIVVKDRPVIVRGKLPAIVEGAQEWPRGIAIGTPEGLTFEYRADDVQLLGVRAGRFLNRSDWGERGGTALEMLGKPIWSNTAPQNPLQLSLQRDARGIPGGHEARRTHLLSTEVDRDRVEIHYRVSIGSGAEERSAVVNEIRGAFRNSVGSGFCVVSAVRTDQAGLYASIANFGEGVANFSGDQTAFVWDASGPKPLLYVARSPSHSRTFYVSLGSRLCVELTPGKTALVELIVLTDFTKPLAIDDDQVQGQLLEEFRR